jgi:hypothetical protein
MRAPIFLVAMILLAGLTACNMSESRVTQGTAGEAYSQVDTIDSLYVLPVKLPRAIHGNVSEEERQRFRRDWPMAGARQIARGVTRETGDYTVAIAGQDKPESDYYFELEITYLDVGDPELRGGDVLTNDQEGWSLVIATGRIINAKTGELVAELQFNQSSGWAKMNVPFERDMANLGIELGRWLDDRR